VSLRTDGTSMELNGHTYTPCRDFMCPVRPDHCQCGTEPDCHNDDHPNANGEGNLHRGRPE
jgi:hypothetical protein